MKRKARALVRWFELPGGFSERWIEGLLTTEHSASSYGQPVFVGPDGEAWPTIQIVKVELLVAGEEDDEEKG
jgi:hypothetical protein